MDNFNQNSKQLTSAISGENVENNNVKWHANETLGHENEIETSTQFPRGYDVMKIGS